MTNKVQPHFLEIVALITGLAITLALSCWVGWC